MLLIIPLALSTSPSIASRYAPRLGIGWQDPLQQKYGVADHRQGVAKVVGDAGSRRPDCGQSGLPGELVLDLGQLCLQPLALLAVTAEKTRQEPRRHVAREALPASVGESRFVFPEAGKPADRGGAVRQAAILVAQKVQDIGPHALVHVDRDGARDSFAVGQSMVSPVPAAAGRSGVARACRAWASGGRIGADKRPGNARQQQICRRSGRDVASDLLGVAHDARYGRPQALEPAPVQHFGRQAGTATDVRDARIVQRAGAGHGLQRHKSADRPDATVRLGAERQTNSRARRPAGAGRLAVIRAPWDARPPAAALDPGRALVAEGISRDDRIFGNGARTAGDCRFAIVAAPVVVLRELVPAPVRRGRQVTRRP